MSKYRVGDEPVPGYEILRELGSGTFGTVYRARGPGETEVAIKVIALDTQEGFKEFKGLQVIKQLNYPHLVPVFAYWLKDDTGRILDHASLAALTSNPAERETLVPKNTMTFVPTAAPPVSVELVIAMGIGEMNLLSRAQQYPDKCIPVNDLLEYIEAAAKAIDYLNVSAGVRHCDIKPQNMLLVGGSVQLCDYGLMRRADELKRTTAAFTLAYAAPECFGPEGPSAKTDQYALAISYYELRTGKLPLPRVDSQSAAMRAHLEGKLDLSAIPEAERKVLRRALSINPAGRFATCRDMVAALRGVVGSGPAPRSRQIRNALVATALVAAIVLAWKFRPRPPADADGSPNQDAVRQGPRSDVTSKENSTVPARQDTPSKSTSLQDLPDYSRAVALLNDHKYSEAAAAFEKIMGNQPGAHAPELNEKYSNALFNQAVALAADPASSTDDTRQALSKAEKALSEVIAASPGSGLAYSRRANIRRLLKNHEPAIGDFDEAIRIDHDSRDVLTRAIVYVQAKRPQKAIDEFTKLINANQETGDAYFQRALTYFELGKYEEAVADMRSAWRARGADDLESRRMLSLWLAGLPDETGDHAREAAQIAQQACADSDWKNPATLDSLAAAMAANQKFAEARKWAEKAIELEPDPRLKQEYSQRLAAYQNDMPFRF